MWCGRNRFRRRAPALAILARLDAVALVLNTNPAGGVAPTVRAAPDDCIFSIGSSETVGMVDVGRPLTTPLIEVSEGCWLDGEASGGHRVLCRWCYCIRSGEFCQHLVHLVGVDPSIHPADTIGGHLPEVHLKGRDEVVKARSMVEASCLLNVGNGETVHRFFVLDPQGGIPGFVVCPTVEGLTLRDHAGQCFHVSFVCCVYPSRSAGQSRSLMFQIPHCPPSWSLVSFHLANHSRRSSRSRFSCSRQRRAISESLESEAKMPFSSNFMGCLLMGLL